MAMVAHTDEGRGNLGSCSGVGFGGGDWNMNVLTLYVDSPPDGLTVKWTYWEMVSMVEGGA